MQYYYLLLKYCVLRCLIWSIKKTLRKMYKVFFDWLMMGSYEVLWIQWCECLLLLNNIYGFCNRITVTFHITSHLDSYNLFFLRIYNEIKVTQVDIYVIYIPVHWLVACMYCLSHAIGIPRSSGFLAWKIQASNYFVHAA